MDPKLAVIIGLVIFIILYLMLSTSKPSILNDDVVADGKSSMMPSKHVPTHIEPVPLNNRSGKYIHPAIMDVAEHSMWGHPGSDTVEAKGTWSDNLSTYAIDPRTAQNHKEWVAEVKPYSQGAFSPDDMDEAVAMSTHRVGIKAFQSGAPKQDVHTLFQTEIDTDLHGKHFKSNLQW